MAEPRGASTVQLSLPGSYSVTYSVVPLSRVCNRREDGISWAEAESMDEVPLLAIYCGQHC
jgi:hypothetical protein